MTQLCHTLLVKPAALNVPRGSMLLIAMWQWLCACSHGYRTIFVSTGGSQAHGMQCGFHWWGQVDHIDSDQTIGDGAWSGEGTHCASALTWVSYMRHGLLSQATC
eukprot:13391783-Heterocapsa_arctica.AAC.1